MIPPTEILDRIFTKEIPPTEILDRIFNSFLKKYILYRKSIYFCKKVYLRNPANTRCKALDVLIMELQGMGRGCALWWTVTSW